MPQMSTKTLKTKRKLDSAIVELQAQGQKITAEKLAQIVGVTTQAVHLFMSKHDMLHFLPASNQRKRTLGIVAELKGMDVSGLLVKEIHQLPIDGLADVKTDRLYTILRENNIAYRRPMENIEQILKDVDLSQHNIQELASMTGFEKDAIKYYSEKHNKPFKRMRVRSSKVDTAEQ
ncbi:hypothetical protein [Burkholderia cenocepacia]|nr:hypothetical protein [Burkholderia cenocepacia]OQD21915.1 hypothetical protein UE98_19125 [Burkholderia cenocepacia]